MSNNGTTIPRRDYELPPPGVAVAPQVNPAAMGALAGGTGDAAMRMVGAIGAWQDHDAALVHAERSAKMGQAQASTDLSLRVKADELANDPDWQGAQEKWRQFLVDTQEKAKESLTDPGIYKGWEGHFQKTATLRSLDLGAATRKRRLDGLTATLDGTLDTYAQAAGRTTSAEDRRMVTNEAELAIADAINKGVITEVDGGKRRRDFLSRADEADFRRLMTHDPEGAAAAILDDRQFGNLDPLRRAQLADTAQRRADTQATERLRQWDKAEREGEKRLKKAIEDQERTFWTSDDPAAQQAAYEHISAIGDPEKLARMRAHMNTGGAVGQDNQHVVMDLERRIREGKVASMADLFGELGRGVGPETMRERIVPLWEATQKGNFGMALRYVQTSLGIPENTLIGDAQKDAAIRVGQAQAEMLALHAKKPDGDWFAEAERVAEKYRKAVSRDTAAKLPLLERQYQKAMQDGDRDKAADLKALIDGLKIQAGGQP